MSKYNYKFQLIPIDQFYFGSTACFGQNNDNTYMLKSELWPQQTTILGMLRKEILIQKGVIAEKYQGKQRDELKKLIGEKGFIFNSNQREYSADFGCIKSISPIFIEHTEGKEDKIYTVCPRDGNPSEKEIYKAYEFEAKAIKTLENKFIPQFVKSEKQYDPKRGLINSLAQIQGLALKDIEDCFRAVEQVGINRSKEMDGLYKLTSYQINPKEISGYVFYAEIDDTLLEGELKSNLVQVGSTHSLFQLRVTPININIETLCESKKWQEHRNMIKTKTKYDCLWVLSDTYLSVEDLKSVDFSVAQSKQFKYITNQWGSHGFKCSTGMYQFIERGSVLYCKDAEQLQQQIDSYKFLKQIGYNYVI